jgi:hypothetical protein
LPQLGRAKQLKQEIIVKLRFDVDQAACFRAGIDHATTTAVVDIDSSKLPCTERDLIADRLHGIDVCKLWNSNTGTAKMFTAERFPVRIEAKAPTYEALLIAIRENEAVTQELRDRHRSIALAEAMKPALVDPSDSDEFVSKLRKRRDEWRQMNKVTLRITRTVHLVIGAGFSLSESTKSILV